MNNQFVWSNNYCGLTHCGSLNDFRRASVQVFGDGSAILLKWWKGCGFSPQRVVFGTVDAAKEAGEQWIIQGGN